MQWNGIKVHIVVLALLVGLGCLWGGQWAFKRFNYERPLARVLSENKDIASYSIVSEGPEPEVEVTLKQVDSLQDTYRNIQQSVDSAVSGKTVKITVKDNRDQVLDNVYRDARLAAYEALDRGNYLEMGGYIQRRASGEGARARVSLDGERLYIQMDHGDKYLYEIIPRTGGAEDSASDSGGGRAS
ncbi:MAG: hypothetical protein M1130_11610 [Actinobacteria bacterium]|nr:hypothetical protein [Actinomycetota bacterium]